MNAAPATLRAGLLLLGLAPATEAAPQVPFRAHYVLGAAGFNVGTAEVHGRLDAQGRLLVTARADGTGLVGLLLGKLGDARFLVEHDAAGDRPLDFAIRVDSPFDARVVVHYDWAQRQLDVDYNGSERHDALDAFTGDPFALMLAIGDARRTGREPPNFWQTPDHEGLRRYSIVRQGVERIDTGRGPLLTERYDCVRELREGEDTLRIVIWLAPELDWLPASGSRLRAGREKARFTLSDWARE